MKKCVLALLLSVLLVCGFALPVCAETVVKDGIEVTLTTDKESYDSLDVIDAKLTVKNTNSFDVENVSMEIKAPEGYMLTSDGETKIGELSAGETQQQQTAMRDAEAPAPVLPQTGDNSHGMLWGLLFVLSSASVCVLVIRHPQGKRIISLLLCVALVAPYMLEMAPALAQEELATEMIMVSKEVLVNGEKVELTGMVTYQAAEMKFAEKTENTSAFGLKINEIADSVKVREGDKLSFTGTISAAEGEVISEVQVFVYDATTEVPYTMGEKYYEAEGLNVAQFDLASVPEMNVGEAFGESDYALTEGGRYAVMFYATDSKGNSFADMDLSISGNQGPVINVRVLMNPANCDHSAKEYTYVRDDSTTTRVTDNEDGLTHQVEPSYERYCADCGMYLMNIWGQGTNADHTIVDGMCTGCGYAPIMLMQEIPSICFDSLEKSEYEVFEEVLITWEEREETDDYVVYVKILDGEPASGSDNEKGELLLSDSNVRFANYSFTVPDRAAGKWIKINVHGKNRQGEQTEAASSIYIFAKESGNKDLGEVILKATKSGSKVLFTVEGNANEVRLYKSEQIHAGSQLRDGVADMYYESFSHSAPHTFSHETSGYHSNKSYLFCVKTDDGRVSNKVFVAGTEICENVPSISEVTLNRSEARLGDPIKIESGTVYGNDLRIYGVNAYMYNENSEIQPVAWDSGYVWKEDIDLSPFDLSSFGAYATKSFMEGLSEPGRHNIYVHIMCYGNVSFTFPTSAEIYLYDEETECCHTEYTDFDNSQIKYTDNGDGKTHTWQNGYNRTCNACSANMGVVYGEENTAPHDYTNGDVCLCGYDRNACNHEPVALEYVKHIFEPIAGDNVNHRIAGVVYKATCGNCQKAYEVIYKDKDIATGETFPREAEHDEWNDGVCGTCGYECAHPAKNVDGNANYQDIYQNSISITDNGNGTHTHIYNVKRTCLNCKYTWTEKLVDSAEVHNIRELTEKGVYKYNADEHWLEVPVGCSCGYRTEEVVTKDKAAHNPQVTTTYRYDPDGNVHQVWEIKTRDCVCGMYYAPEEILKGPSGHSDYNGDGRCDRCGNRYAQSGAETYDEYYSMKQEIGPGIIHLMIPENRSDKYLNLTLPERIVDGIILGLFSGYEDKLIGRIDSDGLFGVLDIEKGKEYFRKEEYRKQLISVLGELYVEDARYSDEDVFNKWSDNILETAKGKEWIKGNVGGVNDVIRNLVKEIYKDAPEEMEQVLKELDGYDDAGIHYDGFSSEVDDVLSFLADSKAGIENISRGLKYVLTDFSRSIEALKVYREAINEESDPQLIEVIDKLIYEYEHKSEQMIIEWGKQLRNFAVSKAAGTWKPYAVFKTIVDAGGALSEFTGVTAMSETHQVVTYSSAIEYELILGGIIETDTKIYEGKMVSNEEMREYYMLLEYVYTSRIQQMERILSDIDLTRVDRMELQNAIESLRKGLKEINVQSDLYAK